MGGEPEQAVAIINPTVNAMQRQEEWNTGTSSKYDRRWITLRLRSGRANDRRKILSNYGSATTEVGLRVLVGAQRIRLQRVVSRARSFAEQDQDTRDDGENGQQDAFIWKTKAEDD